ncbi:MAG: hypothetical protein JNL58_29185 [Planctomyces sp.]|nr:hypothetical protein [Planctomyces sp.]
MSGIGEIDGELLFLYSIGGISDPEVLADVERAIGEDQTLQQQLLLMDPITHLLPTRVREFADEFSADVLKQLENASWRNMEGARQVFSWLLQTSNLSAYDASRETERLMQTWWQSGQDDSFRNAAKWKGFVQPGLVADQGPQISPMSDQVLQVRVKFSEEISVRLRLYQDKGKNLKTAPDGGEECLKFEIQGKGIPQPVQISRLDGSHLHEMLYSEQGRSHSLWLSSIKFLDVCGDSFSERWKLIDGEGNEAICVLEDK